MIKVEDQTRLSKRARLGWRKGEVRDTYIERRILKMGL